MARVDVTNPWPRMRDIVSAVVTGLHGGRFIEATLEALCVQLGATSAWSTLETKGSVGPMHRSRTASFRGVSPAVLAQHVTDSLGRVQTELESIAGPVPYASKGSFIAVPLWSRPRRRAAGASWSARCTSSSRAIRGRTNRSGSSSNAWVRCSAA